MNGSRKRWIVQDRAHNAIYLTEERWKHIVENHPEMIEYERHLQNTIRRGHRRQEPLNPRKYRYAQSFDDLPEDFNHIVVIALFEFDVDEHGETVPNNYVATA